MSTTSGPSKRKVRRRDLAQLGEVLGTGRLWRGSCLLQHHPHGCQGRLGERQAPPCGFGRLLGGALKFLDWPGCVRSPSWRCTALRVQKSACTRRSPMAAPPAPRERRQLPPKPQPMLTHGAPHCPHASTTRPPPPPQGTTSELTGDERPAVKAKPRVEKNRVLVTGGAGFVGSHLCDYLVARGDHVGAGAACLWARARRGGLGAGWLGALESGARHGRSARPTAASHPPARSPCPCPPTAAPLILQVICLDNFFTGSKDNIAHLLDKVRRHWAGAPQCCAAAGPPRPPARGASSTPPAFTCVCVCVCAPVRVCALRRRTLS